MFIYAKDILNIMLYLEDYNDAAILGSALAVSLIIFRGFWDLLVNDYFDFANILISSFVFSAIVVLILIIIVNINKTKQRTMVRVMSVRKKKARRY